MPRLAGALFNSSHGPSAHARGNHGQAIGCGLSFVGVTAASSCVWTRSGSRGCRAAAGGRAFADRLPGASRRPRRCPCLFQPPRPPSTPEIGGLRALVHPLRPAGRETRLEAARHFEPGAAVSTMAPSSPAAVHEASPAEAAAARRTPAAPDAQRPTTQSCTGIAIDRALRKTDAPTSASPSPLPTTLHHHACRP